MYKENKHRKTSHMTETIKCLPKNNGRLLLAVNMTTANRRHPMLSRRRSSVVVGWLVFFFDNISHMHEDMHMRENGGRKKIAGPLKIGKKAI